MVVCVKTSANYHKLRTLLESFLFLVLSTILHVFSDPFFPAILVWHLQFRIYTDLKNRVFAIYFCRG